jgi:hypothetical protein
MESRGSSTMPRKMRKKCHCVSREQPRDLEPPPRITLRAGRLIIGHHVKGELDGRDVPSVWRSPTSQRQDGMLRDSRSLANDCPTKELLVPRATTLSLHPVGQSDTIRNRRRTYRRRKSLILISENNTSLFSTRSLESKLARGQ